MEAQIDRSEALRIGDIQPITKLPTGFDTTGNRPSLDAGEQRFLMFRWNLDSKQDQIRVIFDWESRWTDLATGAN